MDDRGYEEDIEDDQDYLEDKDERKLVEKKESGILTHSSTTLVQKIHLIKKTPNISPHGYYRALSHVLSFALDIL